MFQCVTSIKNMFIFFFTLSLIEVQCEFLFSVLFQTRAHWWHVAGSYQIGQHSSRSFFPNPGSKRLITNQDSCPDLERWLEHWEKELFGQKCDRHGNRWFTLPMKCLFLSKDHSGGPAVCINAFMCSGRWSPWFVLLKTQTAGALRGRCTRVYFLGA